MFSSVYGADLIGPFSGGESWAESLLQGQNHLVDGSEVVNWIVWPWSFTSMLLLEFGILPTAMIVLFVGMKLNSIWYKDKNARHALRWYTVSLCIALYLAPKWCVYFFFYPIYRLSSYKLSRQRLGKNTAKHYTKHARDHRLEAL